MNEVLYDKLYGYIIKTSRRNDKATVDINKIMEECKSINKKANVIKINNKFKFILMKNN